MKIEAGMIQNVEEWQQKGTADSKKEKFTKFKSYNMLSLVKYFKDFLKYQKMRKQEGRQNWAVTSDVLVRNWKSKSIMMCFEKDRRGLNRIYMIY